MITEDPAVGATQEISRAFLSDGNRRNLLMPAISVLEKSKYSGEPLSTTDFTILENTIRDLRRS